MTAKRITIASDSDPVVKLLTLMTADPAAVDALNAYAPNVPPEIWFITIMSPASITLLVSVNETIVVPASAELTIVIWPLDLSSVTPVALLVTWTTAPPDPVS